MKRVLFVLAVLASPAVAETRSSGIWVRYPLPGAEVKSLTSDPSVPGAFYLGTAQGGIYRSVDEGRSWTAPAGGALFPGYSVTALVIDPLRANTVWAGLTGHMKGGILARSDDRGRTFFEVKRWDTLAASRVVAVTVKSGRRLLAVGGDYAVEISENDGETWRVTQLPLDPGSGVSYLQFHPDEPSTLLAGSFRHPFRTTDLGRTWRRISNGMIEDTQVFFMDMAPGNPNDMWAGTCGWVYRTLDGGQSWTRYREGLADRRTHVVRHDPATPNRMLAGTTGGLFESRDAGRTFRRITGEIVVNTLTFDPRNHKRLLVGTEALGVMRSEDGGLTFEESNGGLAEARVAAVATTASGRVVVARSADGVSGGLFTLDVASGLLKRLPQTPPATVVALFASGERILAGTPDGAFVAEAVGAPFVPALPGRHVHDFASEPSGRIVAATDAGVFETRDGGRTYARMGSLTRPVSTVRRARFPQAGALATFSAESATQTLWWDGRDWVSQAVRMAPSAKLSGGFGRPAATVRMAPDPLGVSVDDARGVLTFRPEDEAGGAQAFVYPERGITVSGWAGDPRRETGLYVATMGRGLFRYVGEKWAALVVTPPPSAAPSVPGGSPAAAAGAPPVASGTN